MDLIPNSHIRHHYTRILCHIDGGQYRQPHPEDAPDPEFCSTNPLNFPRLRLPRDLASHERGYTSQSASIITISSNLQLVLCILAYAINPGRIPHNSTMTLPLDWLPVFGLADTVLGFSSI